MIRRYNKNDIPSIIDLESKTLAESLGYEMLYNNLTNDMSYYFVYEQNNKIIAYISTAFDGYAVEILNFCAYPECQNKGIGQELLMYVMDYFYKLNATSLVLEVRSSNARAIHVYNKQGFKYIHTRKSYYSNGEDALVLQKINITIDEMRDAYLGLFCEIDYFEDYIKYSDSNQSDKYCHNFYYLKSNELEILKNLYNENNKFIRFESAKPLNLLGLGFEIEKCVMLHTMLNNLSFLVDKPHKIIEINEENKNEFYKLMVDENLEYGEAYAKGDAKRIVDMSLNGKLILLGSLNENDKIVGVMQIFIYEDCAEIINVWVYDEYHHQGHATSMFRYAKKILLEKHVNDVIICAEDDNTPKEMYKKMGFNQMCVLR